MKTLLIIGGTGFFGKSFLDCFQRGHLSRWGVTRILILSRNVGRLLVDAPELFDTRVELITGDIGGINSLPSADYVIHAAASTDARSYIYQPELEKRNIQAATYNFCNIAKTIGSKNKILYVSSGAVYGPQPPEVEFLNESYPLTKLEELPVGKRDYAYAKRDAEYAIQDLGLQNLNVAIARCFAFIGPWLPRDQHFAIGNFIEDGLQGRPINVKASYPVYRSYMHADDLVSWLMTICDNANSSCPIYNVGSDKAFTLLEVAEIIAKRFSVKVNACEQSSENIDRYIPSIQKAEKEIGLVMATDILSGIDKTIDVIQVKKL